MVDGNKIIIIFYFIYQVLRNACLSKSFKLCLILCYMKPWNDPSSHHFASRRNQSILNSRPNISLQTSQYTKWPFIKLLSLNNLIWLTIIIISIQYKFPWSYSFLVHNSKSKKSIKNTCGQLWTRILNNRRERKVNGRRKWQSDKLSPKMGLMKYFVCVKKKLKRTKVVCISNKWICYQILKDILMIEIIIHGSFDSV
jgi:hypothetical protein